MLDFQGVTANVSINQKPFISRYPQQRVQPRITLVRLARLSTHVQPGVATPQLELWVACSAQPYIEPKNPR
jgi:hypothetical protein